MLANNRVIAAALARPARDNEVIYFADATMKTVVGHFMMDCSGEHEWEGRSTHYFLRYQDVCEDAHLYPIGPGCYLDGFYETCDPDEIRVACQSGEAGFCPAGGRLARQHPGKAQFEPHFEQHDTDAQ